MFCALVNNKLRGLDFRLTQGAEVRFLDLSEDAARKVYMRTATFVLCHAVSELLPGRLLTIEAPVSGGYFFTLSGPLAQGDAERLAAHMQATIAAARPIERVEERAAAVVEMFRRQGMERKAKLIEGLGRLYCHYYRLGGTSDYYYGPLAPHTGYLTAFALTPYADGLLLRLPGADGAIAPVTRQDKMLQAFRDDHTLERRIGCSSVGELNAMVRQGLGGEIVKVSEALQEKRIARIADLIAARPTTRVVLIAGPSSSGKTTFSKRLSIQLLAAGLTPRLISLDDYFVDREHTPRDERGDYDYEHIEALNLPLFNAQLDTLLGGGEVELPRYDFPSGRSIPSGHHLRLDEGTILVMEGIHALNPRMSEAIPEAAKFRVYVSALTSIKLDNHNYIPTTDNRLLRRIVRDHKYRGTSAADTIARWPSVRRGEERWIFPYQENADVMFNSALLYELAVLRTHALPVLDAVHEDRPEHACANTLSRFLHVFEPIADTELPPTSLLREFLGGSTFTY